MCAVKLSENEIFVIGGYVDRNEVWIYDPKNGFARTQGPSLTTGRRYHSCSTMRDGEKTVIIVAGGYTNNLNIQKASVSKSRGDKKKISIFYVIFFLQLNLLQIFYFL